MWVSRKAGSINSFISFWIYCNKIFFFYKITRRSRQLNVKFASKSTLRSNPTMLIASIKIACVIKPRSLTDKENNPFLQKISPSRIRTTSINVWICSIFISSTPDALDSWLNSKHRGEAELRSTSDTKQESRTPKIEKKSRKKKLKKSRNWRNSKSIKKKLARTKIWKKHQSNEHLPTGKKAENTLAEI